MDKAELEELIVQVVRSELKRLFAPDLHDSEPETWVDAPTAAKRLGMPVGALYQAISTGLFRSGQEIRDRRLPGRKKPRYQFQLERCSKRLEAKPEKRKVKG